MIYCVSDIHGCFDTFMSLLGKIEFDPQNDTLYVLGDVIDRGPRPIDCLTYIKKAKGMYLILGNHEQKMIEFFEGRFNNWGSIGNETTLEQLAGLTDKERSGIITYVRARPYYKTLGVNGKRYFLSHAGLDVSVPFKDQTTRDLVWGGRERFFTRKGLPCHTCIFGHTPTFHIRRNDNCSIWEDPIYHDKICIDCGCTYGGCLAALRLDDGKVFYAENSATPWFHL